MYLKGAFYHFTAPPHTEIATMKPITIQTNLWDQLLNYDLEEGE